MKVENLSDVSETVRRVGADFGVAFDGAADRAVFVVDEAGSITYAWVAPNLGTEPDYDAVMAALS